MNTGNSHLLDLWTRQCQLVGHQLQTNEYVKFTMCFFIRADHNQQTHECSYIAHNSSPLDMNAVPSQDWVCHIPILLILY